MSEPAAEPGRGRTAEPRASGGGALEEGWGALFLEALRLDREPPEAVRARALRALGHGVGGFLLFGGEAGDVRALLGELRARAGRPLWLAADFERGVGQQIRGATELPPPAALAGHPEPERATRTAAALTAREARELGLNWALAPVLDLDSEPRNPIVGTRAFGSAPERVAALGRAWVEACQSEGVAACGKHFPGHGRTVTDSHRELPRVDADRAALERDLAPFRAVAGRVAAFMTAHVAYPSLGAEGPATFSPVLLRTLLRATLKFEGLVVTDAMIMEGFRQAAAPEDGLETAAGAEQGGGGASGGVGGTAGGAAPRAAGSEGIAAVRALEAGCDLLLYPDDLEGAIAAVARRAGADRAFRALAEAARRRSAAVLARYEPGTGAGAAQGGRGAGGRAARPAVPIGGRQAWQVGETALTLPDGREAREALALRLAEGGLRPRGGAPGRAWSREVPIDLCWISDDPPGPDDRVAPGARLAEGLRALGWTVEGPRPVEAGRAGPSSAGSPHGARAGQRLVVLRSTPRAWKGRAGPEARTLAAARHALDVVERALAVVLGHERVLAALDRPGLCAWAAEGVMERAAARWLAARLDGAGRSA